MSIGKINELVTDEALAKLDRLIQNLGLANKNMADAIALANQYNNAIGGSKNLTEYVANQEKAKKALENVQKTINDTRVAESNLQEEREKITTRQAAINKRVEEMAIKRRRVVTENTAAEIAAQESAVREHQRLANATNTSTEANNRNATSLRQEAQAAAQAEAASEAYRISQTRAGAAASTTAGQVTQATVAVEANTVASRSSLATIGQGLTRGLGYLRTLAYILPGIGVAGIFTLAWGAIGNLLDRLDLFTGKIVALGGLMKNFNDINKEAAAQFGEESTRLKVLYGAATDVNNSMHDRLLAVLELKKEFPNTFENLKNEEILNGRVKKSYDELRQSILDNAMAKASLSKIEKLAAAQVEAEIQKQKISIKEANELGGLKKQIAGGSTFDVEGGGILEGNAEKQIKDRANRTRKIQDQVIKDAQTQIDFFTKMGGGNNKMALELSKGNAKKLSDQTLKDAKQLNNDELELAKAKLKEQQAIAKNVLDDESRSYQDRLAALAVYVEKANALIDNEQTIANRTPGISGVQKQTNAVNARAAKTGVSTFDINQREKIQKEINDKIIAEQKRIYDASVANEKAREDLITNGYNQELLDLDYTNSQKILKLTQAYSDGLVSERSYNLQLRQLRKESAAEGIDIQIKALEKIAEAQGAALALGFVNSKDLQGTANKITGLKIQSNNLKTGALTDSAKGEKVSEKDKAKEILAFSEQAMRGLEIVQGLIAANAQAKIDALEQEFQMIQQNGEAEKERINGSILSSKEKARQNAIIDAQTANQRIRITQQENEVKRKQAEFDKAAAIAKIIQQTAVAVVSALTIPIYGIALAAVVGALGAAQLAVAIATPLPKFEKGGTVKKDGPIITGEAGPELRIDPSGKYSLTAGHENVTYAKAGTKIINNKDLVSMLGKPESLHYVMSSTSDNKKLEKLMVENNDLLRKQKRPVVNVHTDRWGAYSHQRNY